MRKYIKMAGYVLMLSFTLTLSITFMSAFFHPSMKVLVDINALGEAWVEFVIVLIAIPTGIYTTKEGIKRKNL